MCLRSVLVFCLFVLPWSGCSSTPDKPREAKWTVAFDASQFGALSGVWGSAPDDVWTVGGTTDEGQIHHYDGQQWSLVTVPAGTPLLSWVYGFGRDDVWAVGTKGSALHYDGKTWEKVETGTTEDLWGVWGASADDLWVVGGTVGDGDPALLRIVKGKFETFPLDKEENTRDATSLFKVWGIGDAVFAVGEAGLILRWDGKKWAAISGGAKANDDFVSLWGTSADNIVAVGGRAQARVAHWDGQKWTTVAPSATPGLNAVYMTDPAEAVVGGIIGTGGTFQVANLEYLPEMPDTSETIHGIWCDGADTCFAVGGVFTAPFTGLALKRTVY